MDKDEIRFHQLLQILADQCSFTINEMTLELYDESLREYGYPAINVALKEIFKFRRGGDRFPSVGDILEKMGVIVSSRSMAIDATNSIFWAFKHWRLNFIERENFEELFREKIGDLPWEVLSRMGGYRALYKEWDESKDLAILRAQVRDSAGAVIEITKYRETQIQIGASGKNLIEGK